MRIKIFIVAISAVFLLLGLATLKYLSRDSDSASREGASAIVAESAAHRLEPHQLSGSQADHFSRAETNSEAVSEAASADSSEKDSPESATRDTQISDRQLRSEIRETEALSTERKYLSRSMHLSSSPVSETLKSESFDAEIEDLRRQALDNANALELSSLYRDQLQRQLASAGHEGHLENFACGLRVCMGQVSSPSEGIGWSPGDIPSQQEGLGVYSLIPHRFTTENGTTVHRFVFTTHPDSNTITFDYP